VIKKQYIVFLVILLLSMTLMMVGCSGAKKAKSGDTVKVDYKGTLSDGTVFDSSEGGDPIEFTLGNNEVIPGFEEAIIGMKVGETKTVTIPADKAYGQHKDELVFVVEKTQLPTSIEPAVGLQLQSTNSDGSTSIYTITAVDDTTVTVDGNSPLAGKDLTFEITLREIKSK
jgi:peptidylprolyl isomerase